MRFYHIFASVFFTSALMNPSNGNVLFDFTTLGSIDNWIESSDTVRTVGMSKAVLTLQKTQVFQRAILFTLLNPQPNGAAFAGMETLTTWDLSAFDEFRIRCRGQGQNSNYKVVLRHKGMALMDVSYEQFFQVPMSNETFSDISVPLANFKPYFRGQENKTAEALDRSKITMFGLQIYGGVYLPTKQSGVSSLEIEKIEAVKTK